jgi:hypothetical protein
MENASRGGSAFPLRRRGMNYAARRERDMERAALRRFFSLGFS